MDQLNFKRIPKHIGIIPDGNRRWALSHEMEKKDGYTHGVSPGVVLFDLLADVGVSELTFYGFTKDNNKRPKDQTMAYTQACIDAVQALTEKDTNILVVGNTESKVFPSELLKYTEQRVAHGTGKVNVNFLINYDWNWDLHHAISTKNDLASIKMENKIASASISKIDLIIRWGGRTRLSGFLPVQSVYSDFFILDHYWPDFSPKDVYDALTWYQQCDVTLGG